MLVWFQCFLFDAQNITGIGSCSVLNVFVNVGGDHFEAVLWIVHLVLVDALLGAVSAANSTQSPLVRFMELVVVLAFFGVRRVKGKVRVLVRLIIFVRIVHIPEEVKEVSQFLLDVCEQIGRVFVSASISDASCSLSDVCTIYVRVLFLLFSEMVDTPFSICSGDIFHLEEVREDSSSRGDRVPDHIFISDNINRVVLLHFINRVLKDDIEVLFHLVNLVSDPPVPPRWIVIGKVPVRLD